MLRSRPRRSVTNRAGAGVVAAASVALLLGGCVGVPGATPTPTAARSASPSPEPIFASDEEALAAAEAAYERFLVASAEVTQSGGHDVDSLNQVAVGDALDTQLESAATYVSDNLRSTGQRTFTTHSLQSFVEDVSRGAVVTFYVCDDLRGLDVLDPSGASVVAADRVVDVPYLVVVEGRPETMKVSEKDLWERNNFCS